MDKISIIIPVFNVEQYIRKCLDSVITQTHTNLEILCVNDGSTDDGGKICDEYAEKDKRIKVFHKANGGLSSARNVGLKNFTGEYIGFVDPDDWIEPDMYEVLYDLIKNKNVSVSAAGFFKDTDTETIIRKNIEPIPDGVLSQRDLLTYIFKVDCYNAFLTSACNKLYSGALLKNNNLTFDENIKYAEDVLFLVRVFLTDQCTGAYIDKPLYHHYKRSTSLMNSTPADEKAKGALTAFQLSADLYEEKGYEDLSVLIKRDYCYYASVFAEEAAKSNDKNVFIKMQNEMKVYLKEYREVNAEHPDRIARMEKILQEKI